jgi:hypothetical protein
VAAARAKGLSEVDAALEAIRGMQRLGLYPKPSTMVATRALQVPAGAAVFTISDQEFRVGLFTDIRAAIDRPWRGNREGRRLRDSPRLRHERAHQPVPRGPSGHGVLRTGRWRSLARRCGLPVSAAIPGIVLAAGASRRMGRSKALLPLGASGLPFVRVICGTLTAAGVSPIVVVTRAELLESLAGVLPGIELVVNRDPSGASSRRCSRASTSWVLRRPR